MVSERAERQGRNEAIALLLVFSTAIICGVVAFNHFLIDYFVLVSDYFAETRGSCVNVVVNRPECSMTGRRYGRVIVSLVFIGIESYCYVKFVRPRLAERGIVGYLD